MNHCDFYYIKKHIHYLLYWSLYLLILPFLYVIFFKLLQIDVNSIGTFYLLLMLSPFYLTQSSMKAVPMEGYIQFGNRYKDYWIPVFLMTLFDAFYLTAFGVISDILCKIIGSNIYRFAGFMESNGVSYSTFQIASIIFCQSLFFNSLILKDMADNHTIYQTFFSNTKTKSFSKEYGIGFIKLILTIIFSYMMPLLYLCSFEPTFPFPIIKVLCHPAIMLLLSLIFFFYSYYKNKELSTQKKIHQDILL